MSKTTQNIVLTRAELRYLSKIGVMDRVTTHQMRNDKTSSEISPDSNLTPAQKEFLHQFESRISYFLYEFLPSVLSTAHKDLDIFYAAFTLFDKCAFQTTVTKAEHTVRVCRSFEGDRMQNGKVANVSNLKPAEDQLNSLLKLAFEGANASADFKFKCTARIEPNQLVFIWKGCN